MPVPIWLGWLPRVALMDKVQGPMTPAGGATAEAPTPELPHPAEVAEVEAPPASAAELEPPAPFAELNEALAAAKAKLEELSKAAEIATEVSAMRGRVQALEQDRARLAAALEQAEAARDAAEETAERARDELRLNQPRSPSAAPARPSCCGPPNSRRRSLPRSGNSGRRPRASLPTPRSRRSRP